MLEKSDVDIVTWEQRTRELTGAMRINFFHFPEHGEPWQKEATVHHYGVLKFDDNPEYYPIEDFSPSYIYFPGEEKHSITEAWKILCEKIDGEQNKNA